MKSAVWFWQRTRLGFVANEIKGKELILCQEEMEQGRAARDQVPVGVRVKAEGEWAGHSPQGQVEIVYAPTVATRFLILPDNRVTKEYAPNVARK